MSITALISAARTDTGSTRAENQDHLLAEVSTDGETGLFAVADGMGGQVAGGLASDIVIAALRDELLPLVHGTNESQEGSGEGADDIPLTTRVHDAIVRCNARILAYTDEHPEARGMGSTLTLAFVRGSLAIVGNIGDSRTYRLRDGHIEQLTHDHSLVAHLAAIGQIEPDDVYNHPQRSIIYRALGSDEDIQPDIFTERLHQGDVLLLCSDGLWEMVRDDAIQDVIAGSNDIESVSTALVDLANNNGGSDNISVILVRAD